MSYSASDPQWDEYSSRMPKCPHCGRTDGMQYAGRGRNGETEFTCGNHGGRAYIRGSDPSFDDSDREKISAVADGCDAASKSAADAYRAEKEMS